MNLTVSKLYKGEAPVSVFINSSMDQFIAGQADSLAGGERSVIRTVSGSPYHKIELPGRGKEAALPGNKSVGEELLTGAEHYGFLFNGHPELRNNCPASASDPLPIFNPDGKILSLSGTHGSGGMARSFKAIKTKWSTSLFRDSF
jgi:hypothetical protein